MQTTKPTKEWYDKTWLVILLCIFFFPVGLYALWKSSVISKDWKIGGTIIIGLLITGAVIDKNDNNKPKGENSNSQQNTTTVKDKVSNAPQKKLTNEEYLNFYTTKFSNIKLEKMFDVAPLYKNYVDSLRNVLQDMEYNDSVFHIFENKSIKSLHDKYFKIQVQAFANYIKYGNPDDENHFFSSASVFCEDALEQVLNDPDYEIVKDKYYLKQTSKGYDYKMLIRAKNGFGAKVLKEVTFSLKYNPFTHEYNVANVQ